MEEWVGLKWHRWITKRTAFHHPKAVVSLADLKPQLQSLLHCFCDRPMTLSAGWPVTLPYRRTGYASIRSMATANIAWCSQDELHVPDSVAFFESPALNRDLYFWWVALASHWPASGNWIERNQIALAAAREHLPGLGKRWPAMARALLLVRPPLAKLRSDEHYLENAIRQVLADEMVDYSATAVTSEYPFPVWLWLYPPPFSPGNAAADIKKSAPRENQQQSAQKVAGKKSARRVTEQERQQGLLLFRLENLFTVTDWLNLQRPEEDDEEVSNEAAQALDQITLSQSTSSKAAKVRFDLDLPSKDIDDVPLSEGILLPEWHYRQQAYLQDHCRLIPLLSRDAVPTGLPSHLTFVARRVRRQFLQAQSMPLARRRQTDGHDIDMQSWLDHKTQPNHDVCWPVYVDNPRVKAPRTTLLLADISQSTESYVHDRPVIDGIKDALMVFAEGLHAIHERFSLYAFSSVRRRQVRLHMLKNASEPWSDMSRGRVAALKPGYYTRMGAAIRQSTAVLLDQQEPQKLLLLLTDGKPNDIDHYEHRYGLEDTKKAVQEAKGKGVYVFALTLDPEADDYAPSLFGRANYHRVTSNENLLDALPRMFLSLHR